MKEIEEGYMKGKYDMGIERLRRNVEGHIEKSKKKPWKKTGE